MEELKAYLLEQGVNENEIDEVLEYFDGDVTKDDFEITTIHNSTFDLGSVYAEDFTNHDKHINAVLDHAALGKHIAENDYEYLLLKSGRVILFDFW